jgi:hypothetical protein
MPSICTDHGFVRTIHPGFAEPKTRALTRGDLRMNWKEITDNQPWFSAAGFLHCCRFPKTILTHSRDKG